MLRECFFVSYVLLLVNIGLGFQNGHVRLVGGPSSNEGRVEVYYNGQWGTVCDDGWDMAEAKVVCRYLNFADAKAAVAGGVYGQGSGHIWMDDLTCTGTEDELSRCGFRGWGVSDCKHEEDAGVICMQEADVQNVRRKYEVEHSNEISDLLGALFDSGRDCDFNITVEDGNNGTLETICAHKLILTLDPEASFLNVSLINLSSLRIDVSCDCRQYVSTFVRYLYTREIGITTSSAQCIHKMASDWRLNRLQEESRKLFVYVLPQDPTFQTQISLYEYSVHTGDKAMQKICLRYLAWNFEALVRSPTWTSVPLGTVKALLSRSDLVVPSESYVLQGLESWEAAHVSAPISGDQFGLLELIRFPMISAEDLYRLQNPRYQAGKLLGFQFSALRIGQLFGELVLQWRPYTPRIYTDKPWSFQFDDKEVQHHRKHGYFYRKHNQYTSLTDSFSTPVHTSAYFTLFRDMSWSAQLYTKSHECKNNITCPAARLSPQRNNGDLPAEFQKSIVYENKVVLSCAGKYVFHVQDFKRVSNNDMALIPATTVYPCDSKQHIYQMVVRPKYTTGLKFTEEEEELSI